MKQKFLRGLRISVGIFIFLLGLIGIFIPILQGWLFIIAGIFLINPDWGRRLKEKYKVWKNKKNDNDKL